MGEVPDEFLEGWREGHFPAFSVRDWMISPESDPETVADIRELMDEGLSMEWALAAADQNMPGPDEWDSAVISRSSDGDWDVVITTDSGATYTVDAATNDDLASDNIFAEFWDLVDEYDIDIERDIDYAED